MAAWKTLPKIGPTTKVEIDSVGGVTVDGRPVPRALIEKLSPTELTAYYKKLHEAKNRTSGTTKQAEATAASTGGKVTDVQQGLDYLQKQGIETDPNKLNISIQDEFAAQGLDVSNPTIQLIIQNAGEALQNPQQLQATIYQLQQNPDNLSEPATAYSQAFAESGFDSPYNPQPAPGASQLAAFEAREGGGRGITPTDISGPPSPYEMQGTTGWLQFKNGVLVNPTTGVVTYDPVSLAAGSPRWFRETVSSWDEDKLVEWRKRLHEFGYLDKDAAKIKGSNSVFLAALQAYQDNRYRNGGKPLMGDPAIAKGSREERAKLVNVREEMGAQIRNTVRQTYRNIYGTDPTDGEVAAFSSTIFETAMELQRKYRNKYDDPNVGAAVSEATERQVEKMEGSPEATLLRESDEENTRLRDAMERAVIATRGLA